MRAHRFRLDLTPLQRAQVEDFAAARQQAWNWSLALVKDTLGLETAADPELAELESRGPVRLLDRDALIRTFPKAKIALPWTRGVPSRVCEMACADLVAARSAFFSSRKATGRRVGFPRFIPAAERDGFTVRGTIRIEDGRVVLPRMPQPLRVAGSTQRLEAALAA
jgi:putative transposase